MGETDMPVRHSEVKDWAEWGIRAVMIGIVSLAVSYLKDMSTHLSSLDREIVQLRTETTKTATFQTNINESVMRQLEKIESRLFDVERKCCGSK